MFFLNFNGRWLGFCVNLYFNNTLIPNLHRMVRTITLSLLLSSVAIGPVLADTYPEVLFENSALGGNYAYSRVEYDGKSWVENVAGKLPVSDSVFFTPGNALSLTYAAIRGGSWQAGISYPGTDRFYIASEGDRLTFKLFAASDMEKTALPKLAVYQGDTLSNPIDITPYLSGFQRDKWVDVSVPLTAIRDFRPGAGINGIQFSQGMADQQIHRLYIDQIEFLPADPPQVKLSSQAVLSSAKAYDRHVDLTWQLPLTPSIRYVKVYRSEDNEHFVPVAIRPIFVQKCTDVVPQSDKTYYYKVAWVDYNYRESPFSNVLEAETKTATDDELLDFIKAAHVNYFIERTEVNSGMHAIQFGIDHATVSVKETGLSLLAQVVGAERRIVSRRALRSRLLRILDFLDEVDRYHGAFPALIDGRSKKGVFEVDSVPEADLQATAFLMQGLLVTQAYFQSHDNKADSLTERINALWEAVEWNKFTIEGQESILLDKWSPVSGFKNARPLGGFNASLISYLLALASPEYPVVPEAYNEGLGVARELADTPYSMELANNPSFSVKTDPDEAISPIEYREYPYQRDTTVFGLPITVGDIDTSLLVAYEPFLALDPRGKRDAFADYYANHVNLTQAYQRRDNELGNGSFSVDIWGVEHQAVYDTAAFQPVINPAIAIASYAYVPDEAVKSIRMFYEMYGKALFTEYGFRKWIAIQSHAVSDEYDAFNQAAVVVMLENGRTGLIWDLFSNHPAIRPVIEEHFVVSKLPKSKGQLVINKPRE